MKECPRNHVNKPKHVTLFFAALGNRWFNAINSPQLCLLETFNTLIILCPSPLCNQQMAASLNFPGQSALQTINYKNAARLTFASLPLKRSYLLEKNEMKILQHHITLRRKKDRQLFNSRRLHLIMSSADDVSFELAPVSASDTITQFYKSINNKNLKQLKEFFSEDCYIEECSFAKPFQGKKDAINFFDQLSRSLGQHVKFKIEGVCEGDEYTAAVNWHLEWKGSQIPFTRGCSFYKCKKEEGRLVISEGRVLIESPIKPGGIVLTVLKNVTSIFDEYPKATVWFLNSPHVILQFLLKIYSMLLAPFINPLLAGYIKIWTLASQLFAFAIKLLIQISEFLSK